MPDYQLLVALRLLYAGVTLVLLLSDLQEFYWRWRTR